MQFSKLSIVFVIVLLAFSAEAMKIRQGGPMAGMMNMMTGAMQGIPEQMNAVISQFMELFNCWTGCMAEPMQAFMCLNTCNMDSFQAAVDQFSQMMGAMGQGAGSRPAPAPAAAPAAEEPAAEEPAAEETAAEETAAEEPAAEETAAEEPATAEE